MFDVFKMTDEELKIANAEIAAELRKRERAEEEKMCELVFQQLNYPLQKNEP